MKTFKATTKKETAFNNSNTCINNIYRNYKSLSQQVLNLVS